jgi:hypothetical protein
MNGWKFRITAIILTWGVLIAPGIGSRVYAGSWVDGTPYLYEEARFLAQMLGQDGGVMGAPSVAGVSKSAAYKVGDEREFYAMNMISKAQYSLNASLRAVSDKAYIFVENGRSVASSKIESLLTSFDGIYETITSQFGPPPDSIDGDSRIYILIMDIVDGAQPNGMRMLGYFSPINQYRNALLSRLTDWRSNEVELLYIDHISLDLATGMAESVVAHEFTHLVQWARDAEESIWINEGIAVWVEAMLGYEVDSRISAFESKPDTPLLDWSGSLEDYGAAYLFFAYISEKFGGTPAIAAIVKNRNQGTEGIEQALATLGKSTSFERLFSDWVIANYLDAPELNDGMYGYSTLDIHLEPSVVENQYPIAHKMSRVKPWAAQYTEFEKEQSDSLNVTVYSNGGDDIVAQIIEIGDEIDVSPVKLSGAQSGTALVAEVSSETVLVVTSQPDPPDMKRDYSSYTYSAEVRATAAAVSSIPNRRITTWGGIKRDYIGTQDK